MERMTITIKTLSPIVLTESTSSIVLTGSRPYISGSILRGLLAERYVALQGNHQFAHEDPQFLSLFFDKLRFVHAYIETCGERAIPLPLSIFKAKEKKEGKKYILDTLYDEPEAGYKTLKGMAYVDANGDIHMGEVKRNISFHMSRSSDTERLGGHSKNGQVYNYESLDRGQTFIGEIIGDAASLNALQEAVGMKPGQHVDIQIGRSKYTQYGHCQVSLGTIETIPTESVPQAVYLRLDTPAVAPTGTGERADAVLQDVVTAMEKARPGEHFSLRKIFSSQEDVENFVSVWSMRRPRQYALSAGTIFELQKEGTWNKDDITALEEIMYSGIGDRVEEGFGQLRLWNHPALALAAKAGDFTPATKSIQSEEVKRIIGQILKNRIREAVRMKAYADVKGISYFSANSTHAFSRLESVLGIREDLPKKPQLMRTFITEEMAENGPMAKHLQAIQLNGKALLDYLKNDTKDKIKAPYEALDLRKIVPDELLKSIGQTTQDLSRDELFYDYWLWFFRHARKEAIRQGKERGDIHD